MLLLKRYYYDNNSSTQYLTERKAKLQHITEHLHGQMPDVLWKLSKPMTKQKWKRVTGKKYLRKYIKTDKTQVTLHHETSGERMHREGEWLCTVTSPDSRVQSTKNKTKRKGLCIGPMVITLLEEGDDGIWGMMTTLLLPLRTFLKTGECHLNVT